MPFEHDASPVEAGDTPRSRGWLRGSSDFVECALFSNLTPRGNLQCKEYRLGEDGKPEVRRNASFRLGAARPVLLSPTNALPELSQVLSLLGHNQSLISGQLTNASYVDGRIEVVPIGRLENPSQVALTRDFFTYQPGRPAVVGFDFDVSAFAPQILGLLGGRYDGDVWAFLQHVVPELRGVGVLRRPSSSVRVYDTRGEPPTISPLHNEHCFIVVKDGSMVSEFKEMLGARITNAFGSWAQTMSSGLSVTKHVVDLGACGVPYRPWFEAPPVALDCFALREDVGDTLAAGEMLDLAAVPKLRKHERESARKREEADRRAADALATSVRRQWEEKRARTVADRDGRDYEEVLLGIRTSGVGFLPREAIIEFKSHGVWTVGDILDQMPPELDEAVCKHPLEPDLKDWPGKLYLHPRIGGAPIIFSFRHGGETFRLGERRPRRLPPTQAPLPRSTAEPRPRPKAVRLADARATVAAEIRQSLSEATSITMIKTTTGVGKTQAAIAETARWIAEERKAGRPRRALVAVKTTRNAVEHYRSNVEFCERLGVAAEVMHGRVKAQAGSIDEVDTTSAESLDTGKPSDDKTQASIWFSPCIRPEALLAGMKKGVTDVMSSFCEERLTPAQLAAGDTPRRCPHFAECKAKNEAFGDDFTNQTDLGDDEINMMKKMAPTQLVHPYLYTLDLCAAADIVFASNAYLELHLKKLGEFDAVIIDEDVVMSSYTGATYTVDEIMAEARDVASRTPGDPNIERDVAVVLEALERFERIGDPVVDYIAENWGITETTHLMKAVGIRNRIAGTAAVVLPDGARVPAVPALRKEFRDTQPDVKPDDGEAEIDRSVEGERSKVRMLLDLLAKEVKDIGDGGRDRLFGIWWGEHHVPAKAKEQEGGAEEGNVLGAEGETVAKVMMQSPRAYAPLVEHLGRQARVIMLDATAERVTAERWMDRIDARYVEAQSRWAASGIGPPASSTLRKRWVEVAVDQGLRVTQVLGRSASRLSMATAKTRAKLCEATVVWALNNGYKRVAIATYLPFKGNIAGHLIEAGEELGLTVAVNPHESSGELDTGDEDGEPPPEPDIKFFTGHFEDMVGLNAWESCDGIAVMGRPQIAEDAMGRIVYGIHADDRVGLEIEWSELSDDAPFAPGAVSMRPSPKYAEVEDVLEMRDGRRLVVKRHGYADENADAYVRQQTIGGVLQAIGRVRGVNQPEAVHRANRAETGRRQLEVDGGVRRKGALIFGYVAAMEVDDVIPLAVLSKRGNAWSERLAEAVERDGIVGLSRNWLKKFGWTAAQTEDFINDGLKYWSVDGSYPIEDAVVPPVGPLVSPDFDPDGDGPLDWTIAGRPKPAKWARDWDYEPGFGVGGDGSGGDGDGADEIRAPNGEAYRVFWFRGRREVATAQRGVAKRSGVKAKLKAGRVKPGTEKEAQQATTVVACAFADPGMALRLILRKLPKGETLEEFGYVRRDGALVAFTGLLDADGRVAEFDMDGLRTTPSPDDEDVLALALELKAAGIRGQDDAVGDGGFDGEEGGFGAG